MPYQDLRERCRYRVLSSTRVTPVIRELWLAPIDEALDFIAGQYVLLCDVDERLPQRSYSVANVPRSDGHISLLVTLVEDGQTSRRAHRLQQGDEVLLEGPYGTFVLEPGTQGPVLLLGAGSGLAPVRALAEAVLSDVRSARELTLFFSCRTRHDLIGAGQLEHWQHKHPDFRYLHTLTRESDSPLHERIPQLLPRMVPDLRDWQVFVAGPSGFVVDCAAVARVLGAAADAICTEEFFSDPQPW